LGSCVKLYRLRPCNSPPSPAFGIIYECAIGRQDQDKRHLFVTPQVNCIMFNPIIYVGGDSSTEGQTHLRRGRLVYGGVEGLSPNNYAFSILPPTHSLSRHSLLSSPFFSSESLQLRFFHSTYIPSHSLYHFSFLFSLLFT